MFDIEQYYASEEEFKLYQCGCYDDKGNYIMQKCPNCNKINKASYIQKGECAHCGYTPPKKHVWELINKG